MQKWLILPVLGFSCLAMTLAAGVRQHLGDRVDVEGHALRILKCGQGSPTVVFESGAHGPLESWSRVQPEVSRFTTTFSYDRAGNGRSEAGPEPRDAREVARELHAALQTAHVAPPYILVGHSLGGPFIRVFAGIYPGEVAGMVLVDPSQEELFDWQLAHDPNRPAPAAERRLRLDNEVECAPTSLAQAHQSRMPEGVPVTLITGMARGYAPAEMEESIKAVWAAKLKFHTAWVQQIPNAQHIVTEKSGHLVPYEEPELVINAIRRVVESARNGKTLPGP